MQDKETKKTLVYVGAALLAIIVAWEPWRGGAATPANKKSAVGGKLFEDFKDPLDARNLEIISFDEKDSSLHRFNVAQINGVWSIPSHNNYPADAEKHMAEAATALLDVEILHEESDRPGDRELFGVVAPDPQTLRVGATGVGTRVTLKGDKDKVLADLIIGKAVKDVPTLRYVRRADRDQIYRVDLKTAALSTKFEDWIKRDLLELNPHDLTEVVLSDYSTHAGFNPDGSGGLSVRQRSVAKLAHDDAGAKWELVDLAEFDEKGQPTPSKLAEDEELNSDALDKMKGALDDLQIVDVEPKPAGLSRDLKASEDFYKNQQALASLMDRGFYPGSRDGKKIELFSSEGEATVTTKEGIRYVLRFGELAGTPDNAGAPLEEPNAEKPKRDASLNRYLFIMAEFDESQIPKPQYASLPGDEDPNKPASETPPVDENKPAAESQPAAGATEESQPATEEVSETRTAADDDQPPAAAGQDTPPPAPTADPAKPAEGEPGQTLASPEDEIRIAIQRSNQRLQKEYEATILRGRDKAKSLTDRFADWYFIIPDDVYKKIHLGRSDFVKKKQTEPPLENNLQTPTSLDALQKALGE